MKKDEHNLLKQRRASQAGMLIAAAAIPNTFQRTLMPRKTRDQGVVSGMTMAVDYLIVSNISKALEDIADGMAGTKDAEDKNYKAHRRQRQFAFGVELAALAAGAAATKKFKQQEDESQLRGVARTAGTWLMYAAAASLTINALDTAFSGKKEERAPARYKRPWGLIGGAVFAGYSEYRRRNSLKNSGPDTEHDESVDVARSIGIGIGTMSVLALLDGGEKMFAENFSKQLGKVFPGSEDFFWSVGHSTALAGTALGIVSIIRKVYHKIETVATHIEPAYLRPPESKLISGGPESYVSWESLSVQGRRYVSDVVTKDEIRSVMGNGRAKDPIRVYAGLDSAGSENERLDLIIRELERTEAFDRKYILLVSPTGTGYVNYVAIESAELMSRGDIATAALQYSKRPSPMSLDQVPEGRLQFRLLVKAVSERISQKPAGKRPQLLVFGESLGAWTSQDAFIDQGTDGMVYAGIDKALWIGTPYSSKWKNQVIGKERPDVDSSLVGKFDNIEDYTQLGDRRRSRLRYVMLTHHNDPVALFNLGLLIREPEWLRDPAKRPPTVSHSQYYTSPGTFLLTLIDMGNAMNVVPGKFEASGHDYRADLAQFVRHVYGFNVSETQAAKIEKFLRQNEIKRAQQLDSQKTAKENGG